MIPPDYVLRHAGIPSGSAERARLQLLALEGGAAFLARARTALERGDVGGFVADIARTQDVVLEIAQTADARESNLGAQLAEIYQLIVRRLAHANAERSLDLVDEVLRAFGPIVETYRRLVSGDARDLAQ